MVACTITGGQVSDHEPAHGLLTLLPPPDACLADACLADAGYDSDGLRRFLTGRGRLSVIPNNPTRKRLHPFDDIAYRARNAVDADVLPPKALATDCEPL